MKHHIILLLSISAIASGASYIGQTEKPAEEVYKNIKVFKGTPARDLLPAMKFMTQSLGVKCSFCHDTKDYSADTKEEKGAARHMVEMQRRINTDFFEGHMEVNCISCHNGKTHPARMAAITGLSTRHQRFSTTLKPADLLKKYADTIGGDLKSVSITGTTKAGQAAAEPYQMVQAAPDKFLITMGEVKIGYDGTATWHAVNGHTTVITGDNAASVQRMGRFFRGSKVFDRYSDLAIAGKDEIAGKTMIVVRGTVAADMLTEELYFDEATGLLARVATITRSTIGSVPSFIDFSDYRAVEGVKIPFKIVSTTGESETTEVDVNSAKGNVTVDDKMFSPTTSN